MSHATSTVDVDAVYRRHLSAGRARVGSILGGQVEISSRGCVVTDAAGDEYLNCGGYGVFLLGHGHPRVVDAVRTQVEKHALTSRLFLDPTQAAAAQALAGVAPPPLQHVYFGTSGADAVEAALKLARMHGKRRLVTTVGGFHGKSFGALSVCGNATFREPFAPLLPDVTTVPFGDAGAVEAAVAAAPGECCVVLEPIQAEGGVRLPPADYLRRVSSACRAHDALLVLDEIATGLGRVGSWWASQAQDVVPDVMLIGKPLGGGVVPVGAMLATEPAFAPLDRDPFIHSTTFSGSPLVMAAVSATVEVLVDECIPDRAADLGRRLLDGLNDALSVALEAGLVREVRGAGLLLGIELDAPGSAGELELELVARKVIPNHCLNHHAVVRLTPPAIMDDGEVAWLLDAARESTDAVLRRRRKRAGRR
jgi:putrescine aminotransferase